MAIIFLGTSDWAVPCLRALSASGHEIAAVYTQPDRPAGRGRQPTAPPIKLAAQELGLAVRQPERLHEPQALLELQEFRPEAMVCCAFGQFLRPAVLAVAPRGILNVHPSLLPRFRGATPIQSAILEGDAKTGVTIILMDEGLDTGPVLGQREEIIASGDTAGSLGERLARLASVLLLETLDSWLAGRITPQAQDQLQATITRRIEKKDAEIDWSQPAVEIWRRVRAFNPQPGAHTFLDEEALHVWQAWPLGENSGNAAGTVTELRQDQLAKLGDEARGAGFAVQTGDGMLAVAQVQRSGRRALSADQFVRGMRGFFGRRLGQSPPPLIPPLLGEGQGRGK